MLVAALAALVLSTGCTGADDDAKPADPTTSSSAGAQPDPPTTSQGGSLEAALGTVPAAADVVTFTDLDRAKARLGFAGLTGQSPTSQRLAFWEAARAEGSLFTGQRMYDQSSVLAIDYGWAAEDVDWELDFSAAETGCLESMICDRATGYLIGLRPALGWRGVLESLQDNGFRPAADGISWAAPEGEREPFNDVVAIPGLHALASGNPIGVKRLTAVVDGAPNAADGELGGLARALGGEVESAYLRGGGCIDVLQAFGPDVTEQDVSAYFKSNDLSDLATGLSSGLGVIDGSHARTVLELDGAKSPPAATQQRSDVLAQWPGLQLGRPFAEVATATVTDAAGYERAELEVADLADLRTMAFTDDAPWAVCPAQDPPVVEIPTEPVTP